MEQIYFNHSLLINSQRSQIPGFVEEIRELKKELGSILLRVYGKFWKMPFQSETLESYLQRPGRLDQAVTSILEVMSTGNYFDDPPTLRKPDILPKIEQSENSAFALQLMEICCEGDQQFVLSLADETILDRDRYALTAVDKSLEIFNFIDKDKLSAFIKLPQGQLTFDTIDGVFQEIEKNHSCIKILSSTWKSALKHHFKRNLNKIFEVLTALKTEMGRVLDGIPDKKRIEAFKNETGFDISRESKEVFKNKKFKKRREFYIESRGKKEYFEWHIKIGDTRLHYFIDKERKEIYIGHCGDHLPTPSYSS
ncbi:MAG: hypothetical protein KAW12_27150 [Candidatus Aminicenantes bacterium]|nr:hypothetical protein [Candidatus Aminicenantes bacterium]